MRRNILYLFAASLFFFTTSCVEEKLAFTVVESPVLGLIAEMPAAEGMVAFTGTFYELDKSGILDQNIGIDSIPVAGLELRVESQDRSLLQTVVTATDGTTVFEMPAAELEGVTRLEWAGTYEGQIFRILKNL